VALQTGAGPAWVVVVVEDVVVEVVGGSVVVVEVVVVVVVVVVVGVAVLEHPATTRAKPRITMSSPATTDFVPRMSLLMYKPHYRTH
jgi:hypothetical protein